VLLEPVRQQSLARQSLGVQPAVPLVRDQVAGGHPAVPSMRCRIVTLVLAASTYALESGTESPREWGWFRDHSLTVRSGSFRFSTSLRSASSSGSPSAFSGRYGSARRIGVASKRVRSALACSLRRAGRAR